MHVLETYFWDWSLHIILTVNWIKRPHKVSTRSNPTKFVAIIYIYIYQSLLSVQQLVVCSWFYQKQYIYISIAFICSTTSCLFLILSETIYIYISIAFICSTTSCLFLILSETIYIYINRFYLFNNWLFVPDSIRNNIYIYQSLLSVQQLVVCSWFYQKQYIYISIAFICSTTSCLSLILSETIALMIETAPSCCLIFVENLMGINYIHMIRASSW